MAAVAIMATACSEDLGPRDTWIRYLQALSEGRHAVAFGLLSPESQQKAAVKEREWLANRDVPEAVSPDSDRPAGLKWFGWVMSQGGGAGLAPLPANVEQHVGPERVDGSRALVVSEGPLGTAEVELQLINGTWRIMIADL